MRYNDMNNFLLMVRDIIKENPQLSDKDKNNLIYKLLTNQGISQADRQRDFVLDGTFNRLLYYFKNRRNLYSEMHTKDNYFCLFLNEKGGFKESTESIKIYVPQDAAHLEGSARQIFDFLDKNNYCHSSKIARRVRFDNIVIRMKNKDEATQFLNFVKNNRYIQEGMIKPNPFAYNDNNVAMACDRDMSYNSTVASIINLYMKNIQENNAYDRVSIEDYISFVNIYYRFHFIKYNNVSDTIFDFDIKGANYNDISSNEKIVNLKDIIELHLKSMNPTYTRDNLFSDYDERANTEIVKAKAERIRKERAKTTFINPENIDNYDLLLFNSIDLLQKKYYPKGPDYPFKVIQKYVDTGQQEYLTRDNNLRKTLVENDFANNMKARLYYEASDVKYYYYKKISHFNDYVLNSAIYETYKKYQALYENKEIDVDGFSWARLAVQSYIEGNDATGFTRENDVRKNLINFLTPTLVYSNIAREYNQTISNEEELIIAIDNYIKNVIMNRFSLNNKRKTV